MANGKVKPAVICFEIAASNPRPYYAIYEDVDGTMTQLFFKGQGMFVDIQASIDIMLEKTFTEWTVTDNLGKQFTIMVETTEMAGRNIDNPIDAANTTPGYAVFQGEEGDARHFLFMQPNVRLNEGGIVQFFRNCTYTDEHGNLHDVLIEVPDLDMSLYEQVEVEELYSGEDSEAEARRPANSRRTEHRPSIQILAQSRAEADSSTVTTNDNIHVEIAPAISNDNEAEADALENSSHPAIVPEAEEPMEEEEASGSNILDNDDTISVNEDDIQEVNPALAYLTRDEFSSERFKIKVSSLPSHFACSHLKKLFNDKLHLSARKIKPVPNGACAYVTFRCEDDRAKAMKIINGYVWKKHILKAEPAKPAQDPLVLRRVQPQQFGDCNESEAMEIADVILKATAPWSTIPYEIQLDRKMTSVADFVKLLYKGIANVNALIKVDGNYPIEKIHASPIHRGYRNKCEFTIGVNPETKEKTVGFRATSYKMGSIAIGPVDELPHLPQKMIDVVNGFQTFIRLPSEPDWDPYNPETHKGLWKQLTVRVSQSGEVLVLLLINGKIEDYDDLKTAIRNYYEGNEVVTTFLIKVAEPAGETERNKPEIIFGSGFITEELMGLKFRVSAEAFFQVNTLAAEVLYATIKSVVGIDSRTTVLDVCCGTGTIGLCLAKDISQVIGIEMNEEAVSDAKANASLNGLQTKCRFYASKAENVLEAIFGMNSFDKVVAIVDPPRAGLHNKVIHSLRRSEKFDKIVYVSCDPKAAMKNFIDLCRPVSKNYKGKPFLPTQFIPVDLFPDSPKYELVIVFERIKDNSASVTE